MSTSTAGGYRLWRLRPIRWVAGAVAIAAVLALGACGGDDDGSSSSEGAAAGDSAKSAGVEEARAAVEKGSEPLKFTPPGPAFDVAPGLEGKTIWYVANGLNFPFSQNLVAGVKDAAAVVGMKVVAVDGAGQPAKGANLIQQGIVQHVAAIVIQAFPTDAVAEPIKAAKAAGIPVIQINDGEPGPPSATAKAAGVFANVASCYACGGTALADLVVANTNGDANTVFIDVPDIRTTLAERDGFKARLAELCPDCKVKTASSPVGQWGTLGNLTSSLLKSDPTINYLVPATDGMFPIMKPAVYAASAQDRIQASAYNATKANMVDLQKGELVAGLVGNPEEWIGWGVVDAVLRALSDRPPLDDEKIPSRTFTHEIAKTLDTNAPSIEWYGGADFRDGYKKLWKRG